MGQRLRVSWGFPVVLTLMFASCGGGGGSASESAPIGTGIAGGDFSGMTLSDIEPLTFTNGSADISFDGNGEVLLIVNSTSQIGSDISLQLSRGGPSSLIEGEAPSGLASTASEGLPIAGGGGDASPYEDLEEPPESQFHQYLREMETVLAESGEFDPVEDSAEGGQAGLTVGSQAAAVVAPKVGDRQSFRVISSMSSITNYAEVTGELRLATDNIYFYVDADVRDNISDEDLATVAHNFEDVALPRERAIMGSESDINFDGHISILMTCVVNRMAGMSGTVTGFFAPIDLYQRTSLNQASNAQEIFYVMAPDPGGDCGGVPITSSFAVNNILSGVLAHEYQHLSSFAQHVFRNAGTTEEPWLNECLSHLWEDLAGFPAENASRVKLFFAQPSKTPLIPTTSPTLAERGACYTFLRYLYEQSPDGEAFLSLLYDSKRTGVSNLEFSFQGQDPDFDQFPEFVNRWSIALALSGTGLTSDSRYTFRERSVDAQTGYKTGAVIRGDAQDGRGTVLDGPVMASLATFPNMTVVKGTATQFYRASTPSGTVNVSGGPTNSLAGALVTLEK